jgi:arylformamidase
LIRGRIVDLSQKLLPGKEEYGLELITHFTDELYPQYERGPNVWYILQDIRMSSHCGTHIEFPYHHNRHGMDAGAFPLERLIGDCVLLDFKHKRAGDVHTSEPVTLEEIKAFEGEINPGDMLLFNFNCAQFYGTPRSHDRPYLTYEAIEWLALEKRIGLLGSDASGFEKKGVPDQPGHQILMDNQIPIIESAANLDQLRKRRFTLFVLALPMAGLDACPVRLIAVEED